MQRLTQSHPFPWKKQKYQSGCFLVKGNKKKKQAAVLFCILYAGAFPCITFFGGLKKEGEENQLIKNSNKGQCQGLRGAEQSL